MRFPADSRSKLAVPGYLTFQAKSEYPEIFFRTRVFRHNL